MSKEYLVNQEDKQKQYYAEFKAQLSIVLSKITQDKGIKSITTGKTLIKGIKPITTGKTLITRGWCPVLRFRVVKPIPGGYEILARSSKVMQNIFIFTEYSIPELNALIREVSNNQRKANMSIKTQLDRLLMMGAVDEEEEMISPEELEESEAAWQDHLSGIDLGESLEKVRQELLGNV